MYVDLYYRIDGKCHKFVHSLELFGVMSDDCDLKDCVKGHLLQLTLDESMLMRNCKFDVVTKDGVLICSSYHVDVYTDVLKFL